MGVTAVTDNDTDGETYPIQKWTQELVSLKADHDAAWGPTTRWKGDDDEWVDTSVQGGISQQQFLDDQQMSQPGGWYGDDEPLSEG